MPLVTIDDILDMFTEDRLTDFREGAIEAFECTCDRLNDMHEAIVNGSPIILTIAGTDMSIEVPVSHTGVALGVLADVHMNLRETIDLLRGN